MPLWEAAWARHPNRAGAPNGLWQHGEAPRTGFPPCRPIPLRARAAWIQESILLLATATCAAIVPLRISVDIRPPGWYIETSPRGHHAQGKRLTLSGSQAWPSLTPTPEELSPMSRPHFPFMFSLSRQSNSRGVPGGNPGRRPPRSGPGGRGGRRGPCFALQQTGPITVPAAVERFPAGTDIQGGNPHVSSHPSLSMEAP